MVSVCMSPHTCRWLDSPTGSSMWTELLAIRGRGYTCVMCSSSAKVKVTLQKISLLFNKVLRNQFHTRSYTSWALFTYGAWKWWTIKMPIILIFQTQNLRKSRCDLGNSQSFALSSKCLFNKLLGENIKGTFGPFNYSWFWWEWHHNQMLEIHLTESKPQHSEAGTKIHTNIVNEDIICKEYK